MKSRIWRELILFLALAVLVAALFLSFRIVPRLDWQGGPLWQMLFELIGAFIALEVAAFGLSHFMLEGRRLPLCIGLAYLGAAIADVVAGLVVQGVYLTPLVGQTNAVVGVWSSGRIVLAGFLCAGLVAHRFFPYSNSVHQEILPALLVGVGIAVGVTQTFLMVQVPWLFASSAAVYRPWDVVVMGLLVATLPGYWMLYRRDGGPMLGAVLVSLVMGIFVQAYACRSATLYDGVFSLASVLKMASYFPPLIGLFVESVTLSQAQRKLTTRLQVAQAELSEYSMDLEKKVAQRTQALEERAKDLEAFAYTVSHDLKAPLRGIQTYSQFLKEDLAPKLDEEGRRRIESISKAATNMKMLIDDLLEYSRLDRQQTELCLVDVRELVMSVLGERQTDIDRRGVQVELDLASPTVTADRAIIRLAIANLVDNAIKFSRDATPPRIVVRGREENSQYMLSVGDNGIGFDMEQQEKIFQIFQRLHRSEEFEGTGIGLSTVKRAVEKHGGQVWANSEPGKGATFTLTIPRTETKT